MDYDYIVDDPIMGEVSCANRMAAREYAEVVGGKPYRVRWVAGAPIEREEI